MKHLTKITNVPKLALFQLNLVVSVYNEMLIGCYVPAGCLLQPVVAMKCTCTYVYTRVDFSSRQSDYCM